jgi:hypothetical protein
MFDDFRGFQSGPRLSVIELVCCFVSAFLTSSSALHDSATILLFGRVMFSGFWNA